jgi:Mg-chelatase subunit ChlD
MNWAMRRRVTILAIIFAFLTIFILIPVLVANYEAPSCFDQRQNQDEQGIDCGGVCTRQCADLIQPIKVVWTKMFQSRPGTYYAVAFIENPNFAVGTKKITYTFTVFDSTEEKIAERSGETYLLPNERFPLFVGNITTGGVEPSRVEVRFSRAAEWSRMESNPVQLSVTDRVLSGVESRPRLTAYLTNEGSDTLRDVSVSAVISDKSGTPVAGSATYVDMIAPGEKTRMAFTWSEPFKYNADTEVCEQPVDVVLALDRSGSMSSDSKNPPQPLTQAKEAAADFVSRLSLEDQVAYVSFATDATEPIDQELTRNISRVRTNILETEIGSDGVQYTNIGAALMRARVELQTQRRNPEANGIIILLTDGAPTYPKDLNDAKYPEKYARQIADVIKRENIEVYTIGLGDDINETLLTEIATTPDRYYRAASGADLAGVYKTISTAICKKAPSVIEIFPRVYNVP